MACELFTWATALTVGQPNRKTEGTETTESGSVLERDHISATISVMRIAVLKLNCF